MIQQQTLYAVRNEIINALHVDVRTRGQLDFDASMITVRSRSSRSVDTITGQRFDPDPVRGRSSRPYKTNSCPLPADAFSLSKTHRAIKMLPAQLNALAIYAYAERCEWKCIETVAHCVWQAFLANQVKKIRDEKEKILKGMVLLSMQNWKHKMLTDNELHTPQRIRELLNINENHWCRDWLPHWRQLHELLSNIDYDVLISVYRIIGDNSHVNKIETAA